MIGKAEEALHLYECDPKLNWMENFAFFGFDEERGAGFLLHMKNRPSQGMVEFRLALRIGDQTCVYGSAQPINGSFRYPDFTLRCTEPGKQWTIAGQGSGWPLDAVGMVVGIPAAGEAPLPFEIDIIWASTIAALDWKLILDRKAADAPGGSHYDQGGRISGTLRIGDVAVKVDGLAYRDHSWGPRNFMQMRVARFVGFVSEDMRTYFDGHVIDHGDGRETVGFSYTIEDRVGTLGPLPHVEVIEGEDRDYGYKTVAITVKRTQYLAHTIWNFAMPLVPERYLSNVALVRVELPDGRKGFGIVERGRLFGDDELDGWQRAAQSPGAIVSKRTDGAATGYVE